MSGAQDMILGSMIAEIEAATMRLHLAGLKRIAMADVQSVTISPEKARMVLSESRIESSGGLYADRATGLVEAVKAGKDDRARMAVFFAITGTYLPITAVLLSKLTSREHLSAVCRRMSALRDEAHSRGMSRTVTQLSECLLVATLVASKLFFTHGGIIPAPDGERAHQFVIDCILEAAELAVASYGDSLGVTGADAAVN